MDRDIAVALLDQLHAAQNEFYGGGGIVDENPQPFTRRPATTSVDTTT
jgi:hypothetical protein